MTREQTETALRQREAELARVQRIGQVGGFEIDLRHGHMRNRRSPEYLRLHGLAADAATEAHEEWVARLHPDDRVRAETYFKACVAGNGCDYASEYRIVLPGGEVRWIAASGEIERDAGDAPLRMIGVHIDVTRSKRAETTLRDVLEAIGEAFYAIDAQERFTTVSRRALEVWGLQGTPVLGRRVTEVLPGVEHGPTFQAVRDSIRAGRRSRIEAPATSLNGRWVEQDVTPTADGGASVAFRDIDDRKQAELALRRLNDTLEARVREEVSAREAAQAQLDQAQRMEALGQLAGGIAHDFNNILQVVQGGAALIARRAHDPQAVLRLVGMVQDASDRGSSITRRLLAFSRRGELRAEPVDVAALLEGLHEILSHTLGSGIAVTIELGPDLPPLLADKAQLETVLVNLATNARDAMANGGSLVLAARVETVPQNRPGPNATPEADLGKLASGKLVLGELAPGDYIRLAVSDTGSGMDATTLAHAAEPFFSTKPVGSGTGLGLAMARGFATHSGGSLEIASTPGVGTTIVLWLPVTDDQPGAKPAPAPARRRSSFARVLLAEDDPLVRATLTGELEAAGFQVLSAADGPAALALLDAGANIDLLVSDLSMPGLDGISLIGAAQQRRPGLPAILLTGYATEAAGLATGRTAEGVFSLLRKPISGSQLAERVAILLEERDP